MTLINKGNVRLARCPCCFLVKLDFWAFLLFVTFQTSSQFLPEIYFPVINKLKPWTLQKLERVREMDPSSR